MENITIHTSELYATDRIYHLIIYKYNSVVMKMIYECYNAKEVFECKILTQSAGWSLLFELEDLEMWRDNYIFCKDTSEKKKRIDQIMQKGMELATKIIDNITHVGVKPEIRKILSDSTNTIKNV